MGEIGRLKVTKRERLRLSPQELIELPSHTDNQRDRTLIITAANTALRAGEIGRLRVGDVDLAGGWLRVKIEKSYLEDIMPITKELDAALRVWLTYYSDQSGHLEQGWYLFPSRGPGRNVYTRTGGQQHATHEHGALKPNEPIAKLALIVQRALRTGGHSIEPGEGFHTVRRSVARAFFDANVDRGFDAALRATSALLHHSSSQVTEVYLGLSSEKLHRDDVLRGQEFLTAMVDRSNVRRLSS
jgi:integrase